MKEESTLTFRLDPSLREQFIQTAERMNMPASQILRILVQGFVQRNQEKQQSHNPVITPEEQKRRKKAAKFAIASVGLEGFRVPPTEIAHMNRFISGEISFQEYMEGPFR